MEPPDLVEPRNTKRSAHGTAIGIRWTIGDVNPNGFEALRLSVWGAWKIFGREAKYAIFVNSIPLSQARDRVGHLPEVVVWHAVADGTPPCLQGHVDASMSEGTSWKFKPPQAFPERFELALDNDCILWEMPDALRVWLEGEPNRCLIAEDIRPAFGQFARICGEAPRNSGIRGLPPGFDLQRTLKSVLRDHPVILRSELDEQGLQVAAVARDAPPLVVKTEDVAICSPFYPLSPELGRCGAHFVGLNTKRLPWDYYGRPATECVGEHWHHHRARIEELVDAGGDPD